MKAATAAQAFGSRHQDRIRLLTGGGRAAVDRLARAIRDPGGFELRRGRCLAVGGPGTRRRRA